MRLFAPLFLMFALGTQAKELHNVEYGRIGAVSLQMDASVPDTRGPHPAVILVHGGGWIRGDRGWNMQPLFRPLSEAGFAWFSISYRLATDFSEFGHAVDDVRQAVAHVRSNAAKYGIDPGRVALVGESAGAHLASMAALQQPGSVAAVVALYSPSDLELLARTSPAVPSQIRTAVESSGFADLLLAHLRALSPIQQVTPQAPPFLLIHGTADSVVPFEQSVHMRDRLKKAGVDCELIAVNGGSHGLRYWDRSPAQARYRTEMLGWLKAKLKAV